MAGFPPHPYETLQRSKRFHQPIVTSCRTLSLALIGGAGAVLEARGTLEYSGGFGPRSLVPRDGKPWGASFPVEGIPHELPGVCTGGRNQPARHLVGAKIDPIRSFCHTAGFGQQQ